MMIKPRSGGMGASVQRQTQFECGLPNVAPNHRANSSPLSEDGQKKQMLISQRSLDRHQTLPCTNGSPPSFVDTLKQRVRILEVENRRLMANQGQLVVETNRRVEMHINEVRALKDELKELQISNKELRDLCCFLDDDRQKTKRLSREWQKFGRYTSEVMKQEVKAYQGKLRELDERQQLLINENDELKRLCLYLDEQRQALLLSKTVAGNSTTDAVPDSLGKIADNSIACDSSGCGSSTGSQRGSEDEADEGSCREERRINGYDDKQENTLRMITQQMQTSLSLERCATAEKPRCLRTNSLHDDRLFEYIHSLETRIRQLELSSHYSSDAQWLSSTNLNLDEEGRSILDNKECSQADVIQAVESIKAVPSSNHFAAGKIGGMIVQKKEMVESTTSTMTSSGTTYCSSDTDDSAETAVFVMGNEIDSGAAMLEVRTLGPIDEEKEDISSKSDDITQAVTVISRESSPEGSSNGCAAQMPPTIAPISNSVSRLSLCCSDVSYDGIHGKTSQSPMPDILRSSEKSSSLIDLSRTNDFRSHRASGTNIVRDSLAEAVKVLRVHEMAARKNMRGLTAQETAIVQHMCQIAWDSLDRKSQSLGSTRTESVSSLKAQMTAV